MNRGSNLSESLNDSEAAKRRSDPGRARGQSSRGKDVLPEANLLIAGRYRVTNVYKPEGTSVAFTASDEELAEQVMLITGITAQRLELDPLIVSPFLQCETWLADSPHIVSFREVLTTPVRRYLVTDAPKGQRLSTMPSGFPLPVVKTTARSLAGAVQRLDEFGRARHGLDLEHVWIEPDGAAQLGGIEHALGGAQLIGGWAGLTHAPPETIAATKEFEGDAFEDPDGLLRHLRGRTLWTGDVGPRRANWFGCGRVILWMLTGVRGQTTLPAYPSASEIEALRPDCPPNLSTALAGILQYNPEARDPFIAKMRDWIGQTPTSTTQRRHTRHSRTAASAPARSAPSSGSRPLSGTEKLSRREVQVLNLIAQGLTNQEMADRLVLSHHTVDSHVQNIYRKLGVTSRIDASMLAIQDNLLPKSSDSGETSRS